MAKGQGRKRHELESERAHLSNMYSKLPADKKKSEKHLRGRIGQIDKEIKARKTGKRNGMANTILWVVTLCIAVFGVGFSVMVMTAENL